MSFDPHIFGEGFHRFVQNEAALFGRFSPYLHILSSLILLAVFIYGNRVRLVFTVYFTLNWLFLFVYWGVYAAIYWFRIGPIYLAVYIAAPVLLTMILYTWIRELLRPRLNLEIRLSRKSRLPVILILLWGLWYPTYVYGEGFLFQPKDLLFSYYGLMPCPTTMVVLSVLALRYPETNSALFRLLTMYAIFIGTATVMSGWLPDIPFVILGVYTLTLMVLESRGRKKMKLG